MTCAVGLKKGNKVYLGADSRISWGTIDFPVKNYCKIINFPNSTIAWSSHVSIKTILENNKQKFKTYKSIVRFVKKVMNKYLELEGKKANAELLIAWNNKLYYTDRFMEVYELDYWAIGSGSCYALGALELLKDLHPKEQIETALEIACKYDTNCGGEFVIKEV